MDTLPSDNGNKNGATAMQGASVQGSDPQMPEDNFHTDMIDQSWILRAKAIVQAAKDDPFTQAQQLAALRADYLQKRYGKTIKHAEIT